MSKLADIGVQVNNIDSSLLSTSLFIAVAVNGKFRSVRQQCSLVSSVICLLSITTDNFKVCSGCVSLHIGFLCFTELSATLMLRMCGVKCNRYFFLNLVNTCYCWHQERHGWKYEYRIRVQNTLLTTVISTRVYHWCVNQVITRANLTKNNDLTS